MAVVTIYAELGSGGEAVARSLAQRLNYALVEAPTLNRAAEELHASGPADLALRVEELAARAVALGQHPEQAMVASEPALVARNIMSEEAYLRVMQDVIRLLAARGNMVITGRGAEALLRDDPRCLTVRLVAPSVQRVDRVMQLMGWDRPTATTAIERSDNVRGGYMKYSFNINWTDPSLYDITLSAAQFTPEEAMEIITCAVGTMDRRVREAASAPAAGGGR